MMDTKTKVGIIGASGYAGAELVRLLINHPMVEISAISSVSFEGKKISELYPSLVGICDDALENEDSVINNSDVVFAALPHGLSEKIGKKCFDAGRLFVDLGADFRLEDECEYEQWYGLKYEEKTLHDNSIYGLPELFPAKKGDAKIIANPGCYPTCTVLGLAPAMDLIDEKSIIVDAKSGVTGAGRGLSQNLHYAECNESFTAYKVASHRHTPEIEQVLSKVSGKDVTVTFTPHLLPVNRGILSTIYSQLTQEIDIQLFHKKYVDFYKDNDFVKVLDLGKTANIKDVRLSNYCHISVHIDTRTNRLIVVSAIDNMLKGAAGQAIQNMNIHCGWAENIGLTSVAPAF